MARRRGRCGEAKLQDRILRLKIESARKNYRTFGQLVDHLRSSNEHYARRDLKSFTDEVSKIIQVSSRKRDIMVESNDDGDTPIRKKRRKIDEKEEKLRLIAAQQVRRRHSDVLNDSGGGSSSCVASASSSEGDDSSDEGASSSVDTIYGEKFEPGFDLMKSMLREKLRQKSKKKLGGGREVKEAVELEVVGNEDVKEVHLMNEEGKLGGGLSKIIKNNDRGRNVNKTMFKDLGGMGGVIEELKVEILVPLYQPRLLPHLGVEPMAGLLLHGPPGCGKTKLAHAIAY